MMVVKGEVINAKPRESPRLGAMIKALREMNGCTALAMRMTRAAVHDSQEPRRRRQAQEVSPTASSQGRKRTNSRGSVDTLRLDRHKHARQDQDVSPTATSSQTRRGTNSRVSVDTLLSGQA